LQIFSCGRYGGPAQTSSEKTAARGYPWHIQPQTGEDAAENGDEMILSFGSPEAGEGKSYLKVGFFLRSRTHAPGDMVIADGSLRCDDAFVAANKNMRRA